jgi:hypothetical protein
VKALMKILQSALKVLGESRRAYVTLNLVYYGLVACGMVFTALDRSVQRGLLAAVGNALTQGPLAGVAGAYTTGQIILAIALTFAINLVVASFVSITLPSLIIPFSGMLVGLVRAVAWGLLFSPPSLAVGGREAVMGLLVGILLVLEGQGYVLAMLAAWVQGRALMSPQSVGAPDRGQAYLVGIKRALRLYVLVALVLAVAAIYEAVTAILVLPLLR